MTEIATTPHTAPAKADWHRIFDSLPDEHDYWVDEVTGTLPAALRGTLYRNGPGINEIGGRPFAHLFDGHGMISRFVLDGRRVHFSNRFVRTHKFLAERDASRPSVRGFGESASPLRSFVSLPGRANAANTSVTLHGENLLALWEGGRPWALDPDTLQTRGEYDFDGELKALHAFSAHPKYDPRTGEMFNFGVQYVPRPRLRCYRVERAGRLRQLGTVPIPHPVMNHDFALTERHLVFVIDPILINVGRLILGSSLDSALRWDPSKPTVVVLVPRDGSSPRMIETQPFFHFHFNNAFEDRGDTVVDLVRYDDYTIGESSLRKFRIGGFDEPAALWRLRIKPDGTIERHELCPWQCEFPQHDWRRTSLRYRYSYLAGRAHPDGPATDAVIKVDHESGLSTAHTFGEGHIAGEPIFVTRSPDAREDEGWLLSVVYSAAEHRSRLVILDAAELESDPVAVAHLRHHLPFGFHGTFTNRLAETKEGR